MLRRSDGYNAIFCWFEERGVEWELVSAAKRWGFQGLFLKAGERRTEAVGAGFGLKHLRPVWSVASYSHQSIWCIRLNSVFCLIVTLLRVVPHWLYTSEVSSSNKWTDPYLCDRHLSDSESGQRACEILKNCAHKFVFIKTWTTLTRVQVLYECSNIKRSLSLRW